MTHGVRLYLVGSIVLVSLAGCGRGFFQAEREPWRAEAEAACLKSGAVKESADIVRIDPISGPGMCGAEFPLKVAAIGEPSGSYGFADEELRPPGNVGNQPRWPVTQPQQNYPASGYPQRSNYPESAVRQPAGYGASSGPVSLSAPGVAAQDDEITVSVRNRGVIPADLQPKIFDPFQGRQRTSSRSRGLGLGLFISQQIATAHGGGITVQSSEESGETVFTVRLPRRIGGPKYAHSGKPKIILIVDDDEDIRDSLREAFEDEGYMALTAANGQEALDFLSRGEPQADAVILDLVLPVIDGSRVYRAMQADPKLSHIPVIISTSNPGRAPAGVVVVPKPLKLDRLLDTVSSLWRQEQRK